MTIHGRKLATTAPTAPEKPNSQRPDCGFDDIDFSLKGSSAIWLLQLTVLS